MIKISAGVNDIKIVPVHKVTVHAGIMHEITVHVDIVHEVTVCADTVHEIIAHIGTIRMLLFTGSYYSREQ